MIGGKKVLAVIPARGGSKGVPRKNVRPLGGKPLIAWTIDAARKSRFVDRAVVSTEDKEIAEVAAACGGDVPFLRPASLSGDAVSCVEPVVQALEMVTGYDYVVLLQPTSPLREPQDIDACIERCVGMGRSSCISVCDVGKPAEWIFYINEHGGLASVVSDKFDDSLQRQALSEAVFLNGSVYVANINDFKEMKTFFMPGYVVYRMPKERSIDIDTFFDFELIEALLLLRNGS